MATLAFPLSKDWLFPLKQYLNRIKIRQSRSAHWLCRLIPSSCPFERTFYLGKYRVHIPPLCQINPFYNEVVGLRMRALDYLTALEVDVSAYVEV